MSKSTVHIVGTKNFHGEVDITDPCYDRDVWCRMNNIKIADGEYTCVAYISKHWYEIPHRAKPDRPRKYYDLVDAIGIFRADNFAADDFDIIQPKMERIGSIGVDAGLAGFFHNKPDYDDNQWAAFCDRLKNSRNVYIDDEGFFSSSGGGDGCYDVYAYNDPKTKEITALIIDFDTDE